MRITNQLRFDNFSNNYRRSSELLNKLNEQISSGHKIQDSFDDSSIYIDSARLEYEKNSFAQIKKTSQSAQEFASNADTVLSEFSDKLIQFKTKLIQAANASNSGTNFNAIANDLEAIKENLKDLANSSVNGKFLFSGTAFATKPIDNEGNYLGNDKEISATTGADVSLVYNIDGNSLFLGQDSDYNKIISTNVKMYSDDSQTLLKGDDSIKKLVEYNGDNSGDIGSQGKAYFYLQGKNSDGTSFKNKIELSVDDSVDTLLDKVKNSFTPSDSVNVILNDYGQIEITDKNKGSKLVDFSMIGAVDKDGGSDANVTDIDDLASGSNVNIVSFLKSGYTNNADAANEEVSFDRNYFSKKGNNILGNISQIDKNTNDYATAKTLLVDASGVSSLDNTAFAIKYTDINGNAKSAQINLSNSGSTFSVNGNSYHIYDAQGNATNADDMTFQQLNDVASMIVSDNLPATDSKSDYDSAIQNAKNSVNVSLDYRGRLEIEDKLNKSSKIEFSMYDSKNDDFSSSVGNTLSFMSNNAVAVEDPNVDIFKDLDAIIKGVREGRLSMDGDSGDKRNIGIENAIRRVEHIRDHVAKMHTKIGSLSNALDGAYQRSDMLQLQVTTLQSDIADTDMGETLAKYNQVSVGFQAMLSTIAKINKISLLDYI